MTIRSYDFISGVEAEASSELNVSFESVNTSSTPLSIVAGNGIPITSTALKQIIYVVGSGGAVNITANPQIAVPTNEGTEIILYGTSDTNTVTLENGTGLLLDASVVLKNGTLARLVYSSSAWRASGGGGGANIKVTGSSSSPIASGSTIAVTTDAIEHIYLSSSGGAVSASIASATNVKMLTLIGTSDTNYLILSPNEFPKIYLKDKVTANYFWNGTSWQYIINTNKANILVGSQAGNALTTGSNNYINGYQAGYAMTTAVTNFIHGYQAGFALTTSNYNFLFGNYAGQNLTTQSYCIGIGSGTLRNFVSGENIAIGTNACVGATGATGDKNIAIGYGSNSNLTSGNYNLSIGYQAQSTRSTGEHNIALGYQAAYSGTTSSNNIAIGYQALMYTLDGNNIAIGYQAVRGASPYTSMNNVGIGSYALFGVTTGDSNVAIGSSAINNATTAANNVAIGASVNTLLSTGYNNVFIGYSCGNISTGYNCTIVGNNAGSSSSGAYNSSAIGNGAVVSTNNMFTLGNSSITDLRCQDTSISVPSDARLKTWVELGHGLDFINDLHPVLYRYKEAEGKDYDKERAGFIAQEHWQACQKNGVNVADYVFKNIRFENDETTDSLSEPEKMDDNYDWESEGKKVVFEEWSIAVTSLVPALVKSIQELTVMVKNQAAEIKELKTRVKK